MRDGVVGVGGDSGFVPLDSFVEQAVFQSEIAEVGQRRCKTWAEIQRGHKIGARALAVAQTDSSHSALVEEKRALCRRARLRAQQLVKCRFRTGIVAPLENGERESKFALIPKHATSMFTIDVVTLFPEVFAPFVGLSIVGRAVESEVVNVRYHHLLDELTPGERADDSPFGGGPGMVLRIEPIARALDRLTADAANERQAIVVPSASGSRFTQSDATRWAGLDRLAIVCGHYEGIDDRLAQLYPIEERSLGDFVLTGGEIPALAFMDATVRLLAGALRPESLEHESFTGGTLDYPSFTRPASFRGVEVPPVLLSGDHAKIALWRREQSRLRTAARRRDLFDDALQGEEAP